MFELKRYRGVMFHDTRKSDAKFGEKLTCGLENDEEFGEYLPGHSKVKIGTLMDPFILSRKCLSLKFTEELSIMTMKNDARFEEELTCFKIDMRNLMNLTRALEKFTL